MFNTFDGDLSRHSESIYVERVIADFVCEIINSYLLVSDDCAIEDLFEAMSWHAGGFLLHEDLFGVADRACALFGAVECVCCDHADLGIKLHSVSNKKYFCDEDVCDSADSPGDEWHSRQSCVNCLQPYDVIVAWELLVCDFDGVVRNYYLYAGILYDDNGGIEPIDCWGDQNWVGPVGAVLSKISSALGEIEIANTLRDG